MSKNAECGNAPLSQGRVAAKHHYRFKYLKSEHWGNLRIAKLASVDAKCKHCGARDLSNDVHHLRYKKLYDVELDDLVVLCRSCHDLSHLVLDLFRERIKSSSDIWKETRRYIFFAQKAGMIQMELHEFRVVPPERFINVFWKVFKSKRKGLEMTVDQALERAKSERPDVKTPDRYYMDPKEYKPLERRVVPHSMKPEVKSRYPSSHISKYGLTGKVTSSI